MILQTNRLIIREYVEGDLWDFHRLLTNRQAMALMPEIKSDSVDDTIKTLFESIQESKLIHRSKYFFAIEHMTTGKYIGEIGYLVLFDTEEGKVVNLGYFISPEFWGQGYMFEAATAVVDNMFKEQNVLKVEAGCLSDNLASIGIMKKLGMTQESYMVKHMYHNGKLHDRVDYRLLKSEWEQRSE